MKSATVLAAVVSFAALQVAYAAPTGSDTAKRSTTSNGVSCYFSCSTATFTSGANTCSYTGQNPTFGGICGYSCGPTGTGTTTTSFNCLYSTTDGSLQSSGGNPCPAANTTPVCTSNAKTADQFKRDVAPRELTSAEKLIQARQFKYTKPAA